MYIALAMHRRFRRDSSLSRHKSCTCMTGQVHLLVCHKHEGASFQLKICLLGHKKEYLAVIHFNCGIRLFRTNLLREIKK